MTASWLNLLGLARRAGKMAPGENQVTQAMKREQVRLLIIAEDAGPSLYRKYHLWAQDLDIPLVRIGTKVALGHAIGMGPHAVIAILDKDFSGRILDEMRKSSGGIILDRKRQGQSEGVRASQGAEVRQPTANRSSTSSQGGKHQKPHEYRGAGGGQDGSRHHGGKTAARTQNGRDAGVDSHAGSGGTERSARSTQTEKRSDHHRKPSGGSPRATSHDSPKRSPSPK